MNFKNIFLLAILSILFGACSSDSSDPIPEEIIENPTATTLVFPENNTECNEGTILSDSQSRVTFRWNASEFTDSYDIVLENLDTFNLTTIESATNSADITIDRGVSYKWYVISNSEKTEVTATSETFRFFNAAPGIVNHVPFSAEAIAPINGSEVTTTSGKVMLQWEASDIDNDIKDYEVFFGTNKDQLESMVVVPSTSLEVTVTSGTVYYWSITTKDETDNTSASEVFSFTVN